MKVALVEFWGGPYDGVRLPVSADMETVLIREGAVLHRYDLGEIREGPKVRPVFRRTQITTGAHRDCFG